MIYNFTHYTVNTGNSRISYPSDVSKSLIPTLQEYINLSKTHEYIEIIEGTKINLFTATPKSYIFKFCIDDNGSLIPILYSFGCCNDDETENTLSGIRLLYKSAYKEEPNINLKPPFVADIVLPTAMKKPSVLEWTGDFTKCMGWAIMDMESIKKFGNNN